MKGHGQHEEHRAASAICALGVCFLQVPMFPTLNIPAGPLSDGQQQKVMPTDVHQQTLRLLLLLMLFQA